MSKKPTYDELLSENLRLRRQLDAFLAIRRLHFNDPWAAEKINYAKVKGYLESKGWVRDEASPRDWHHRVYKADKEPGQRGKKPLFYHTIDRDGYGDHERRVVELIRFLGDIEQRSDLIIYWEMLNFPTNAIDAIVRGVE